MVEARRLSGGYNLRDVVCGVNLTVGEGQLTALIGPNGCGKSTLLRLLSGMIRPTSGDILLNNKPLFKYKRTSAAQSIAHLTQSRTIPDVTVERLVLMGRFPRLKYPKVYQEADKLAANNALQRTSLTPHRYKRLAELSGGELQRAYLAMLIAQDTPHILLDEPTTHLDIVHQLELMDWLNQFRNEGKAVLIVLHDIQMALEIADYIAVMKDGQIIAYGKPSDVLRGCGIEEAFGVKVTSAYGVRFVKKDNHAVY